MESVREAVIEHANKEAEYEEKTATESKPIPTPTVPQPENPRPRVTSESPISTRDSQGMPSKKEIVEKTPHNEPKALEKKKSKHSWTKRIFGSD
jgi:hypothetical protein